MCNMVRRLATPLLLAVVVLTALRPPAVARASATFVVNSIGDEPDVSPGDGICQTGTSTCTLRAAIMEANASAGVDNIFFSIAGPGVHGIVPATPLPNVTQAAVLNATTQPGYAGAPLVDLDGVSAGAGANGLALAAGNTTVTGFAIFRFGFAGIHVSASDPGGDVIQSNVIGTNAIGNVGLGNGTGVAVYGQGALIGGPHAGNVISGNLNSGVLVSGASAAFDAVEGNLIGVNVDGASALANNVGILTMSAGGTQIGGDYTLGYGNVISGNTNYGVWISGGSGSVQVEGNAIGANAAGALAIPNAVGVVIDSGSTSNYVGLATANSGNLISGNLFQGIWVSGSGTSGNAIESNGIGLKLSGAAALPNGAEGILVDGGAQNTFIGSAAAGFRNYISGNGASGIAIDGSTTTSNQVTGNYIGTDSSGATSIPNATGVLFRNGAHDNTATSNVVSGNNNDGLRTQDAGTSHNVVQSNSIGTNSSGSSAVANGGCGVAVAGGDDNVIISNEISANTTANVCVLAPATNTNVTMNTVGTTADGMAVIGTPGDGVDVIGATDTVISNNTIDGNQTGVYVSGSTGDNIAGNAVGTDAATHSVALGNRGDGMRVDAGSQASGISGNFIAHNGGNGVVVTGSGTDGIQIQINSIHDNALLGIDIGADGVTPNDAGDLDSGPNGVQNFPVVTSAIVTGGNLVISGTLTSTAGTDFDVDFYAQGSCDPSGYGEGETHIAGTSITTDGSGNASFAVTIPGSAAPGDAVTAIATLDANGAPPRDTSEFSHCTTVTSSTGCTGDPNCDGDVDFLNPGLSLPCQQDHIGDENKDGYSDSDELTSIGAPSCTGAFPVGGGLGLTGLSSATITAPCVGRLIGGTVAQDQAARAARADVDLNSRVNILDLSAAAGVYNQVGFGADANDKRNEFDQDHNGRINILDLSAMASVYNRVVPAC